MKVDWGIDASVVDDFDRSERWSPYRGKTPPNGVYRWRIDRLTYQAGTNKKKPVLAATLVLTPRDKDERQYNGYRVTKWMHIGPDNAFAYTEFLDAIGVTGKEFTRGTDVDKEGNVRSIGRWKFNKKQEIDAMLKDGVDQHDNPRKEIGWCGKPEEEPDDEDTDEGYDEEEDEYEDDDEDSDEDDF